MSPHAPVGGTGARGRLRRVLEIRMSVTKPTPCVANVTDPTRSRDLLLERDGRPQSVIDAWNRVTASGAQIAMIAPAHRTV